MLKRFDFVADDSHGWLKVPVRELQRLDIVDQISAYSYVRGDMAYLEEGRDMKVFTQARDQRGEGDIRMIEHSRKGQSRIRKYDSISTIQTQPVQTDDLEVVAEADMEDFAPDGALDAPLA